MDGLPVVVREIGGIGEIGEIREIRGIME